MNELIEEGRESLMSEDEEERRRAVLGFPEGRASETLSLLLMALADASWRVRKAAVERLGRWPDPQGAVQVLIRALEQEGSSDRDGASSSDRVGFRNAAVEALSAIGTPAVKPLCHSLETRRGLAKFLIEALAAIGDRRSVPSLARMLQDADDNVRAAAAEALGSIGGPEAGQVLLARLRVPDLLGRLAVLEALNRIGTPVSVRELVPLLKQPVLRRAALEALGHAADPLGLEHLLDGLQDRIRGSRESATVAVAVLYAKQSKPEAQKQIEQAVAGVSKSAIDGLIAAVSADVVSVRRAAVKLIGWGRFPEALPRLVDALRDEEVHAEAVLSISTFGEAACSQLVTLAEDVGPELRAEVFKILPRLGRAGSHPVMQALLCRSLDDEDEDAATAAARALGEVGTADCLGPLFKALDRRAAPQVQRTACAALAKLSRDYYGEIRILMGARGLGQGFTQGFAQGFDRGVAAPFLCRVLGAAGRPEDRQPLLRSLRADDAEVRRAAAEAIAALGSAPEAREALVYSLADEDGQVRAAAAAALGQLGDVLAMQALLGTTADEEEAVRIAAVNALGQLADPRANTALRTLVRGGSGALVVCALEALSRIGDAGKEEEELFIECLDSHDAEVVKAAARALAACPSDPSAAPAAGFIRLLEHDRWDVRRLGAEILGSLADGTVTIRVALASRAEVETDPLVRESIQAALAQSKCK